jgi:small subunit ribosomal protein S16
MLVLRLSRVGKNNQPSYKVVVTQKTNPARGGRFVEQVGTLNPVTKEKKLNKERIQYWLSKGVQPSATLHNLLIREGILSGNKIPKHKKSKKPAATPVAAAPASAEAAAVKPVAEAPKAAEAQASAPAESQPKTE